MRKDSDSGATADRRSGRRLPPVASAVLLALAAAAGSGAVPATGPQWVAAEPAAGLKLTLGRVSLVAASPANLAQVVDDRMTEAQRIGQLFMVGTPVTGLGAATGRRSRPTTSATSRSPDGRQPVHQGYGL